MGTGIYLCEVTVAGPSKREARRASEQAMLEAGAAILRDNPVGDVLNQIKAGEVARRTGRTTGAFYNLWPDQESYRSDLLDYVLAPERYRTAEPTLEAIKMTIEREGHDLRALTRQGATANFEALKLEPWMHLEQALWAKSGQDPNLRERLRTLYRGLNGVLIPTYEMLLDATGRRMRPPFTPEQLAVVLLALVHGLYVRWAVDPEAVPDRLEPQSDDAFSGLFAELADLIVLGMTEPTTE